MVLSLFHFALAPNFAHTLDRPQLFEELQGVLERGLPVIDEVTARDGTRYLMRVNPYRSDRAGMGVILTLTDLSVLRTLAR